MQFLHGDSSVVDDMIPDAADNEVFQQEDKQTLSDDEDTKEGDQVSYLLVFSVCSCVCICALVTV